MAFAVVCRLAIDITASILVGEPEVATVHVAGVSEASSASIAAVVPLAAAAIDS